MDSTGWKPVAQWSWDKVLARRLPFFGGYLLAHSGLLKSDVFREINLGVPCSSNHPSEAETKALKQGRNESTQARRKRDGKPLEGVADHSPGRAQRALGGPARPQAHERGRRKRLGVPRAFSVAPAGDGRTRYRCPRARFARPGLYSIAPVGGLNDPAFSGLE